MSGNGDFGLMIGATPDWFTDAACHGVGPDMFFPELGQTWSTRLVKEQYCDRCPVTAECLEAALDLDRPEKWGVWGGTGEGPRKQIRKKRRAAQGRTVRVRSLEERQAILDEWDAGSYGSSDRKRLLEREQISVSAIQNWRTALRQKKEAS